MNAAEVVKQVKENVDSYESTSLANDDVCRLLWVVNSQAEQLKQARDALREIKQDISRDTTSIQWVEARCEQALKGTD